MLKKKWGFFNKRIDPIHSERDYENEITSSRDDVLFSNDQTDPAVQYKFQRKATRKNKSNMTIRYIKTLQRLPTAVSDQTEEEDEDRVGNRANFYVHGQHVVYCKESLHLFTEKHLIRRACVWLISWKYTEYIIVAVIILNAVLLGLIDHREGQENEINKIMKFINPIFIGLYAIEALVKIIAMGFCQDEGSYLRNLQNIVDLFVVISGFFIGKRPLEHFSILRLFRVFLILKDFKFFRMTSLMFSSISNAIWQFVSVMVMMLFFFGIFAILGLNIYTGVLSRQCRTTQYPANGVWPVDDDIRRVCGGYFQCPDGEYCGSDYDFPGQIKSPGEALNHPWFEFGLMNFDNILNSMAMIFTMMTMVSWSNIFDLIVDATDKVSSLVFFVGTMLVILALNINLVVAIIIDTFSLSSKGSRQVSRSFSQYRPATLESDKSGGSGRRFSFRAIVGYIQRRYMYAKEVNWGCW